MAASGATPREYGLKVQSHPVLMVTSSIKMRTARNLELSFSGGLSETVTFRRESDILRRNLEAARQLISSLGSPETNPTRTRLRLGTGLEGVSVERHFRRGDTRLS